jgi:hypothetical protein
VTEHPGTSAPPGAYSKPVDGEDASEPTVVSGPTAEETEDTGELTVNAPVEAETRAPGSNDLGKPGGSGRGIGRLEQAVMAPNIGNPRPDVGHPANGKPEERGNEEEHGRGGSQLKVTLCHKSK